MKHTHSQRLETWLGAAQVTRIADAMRGFYAPIALHGVPGAVYAMPGGDFCGEIRGGQEVSAVERAVATIRREDRARRAAVAAHKIAATRTLRQRLDRRQHAFASLSALVAAATGGKAQNMFFQKAGVASNAIGNCIDLWAVGAQPSAGAAGAAAPGGTASTSATAGALKYNNPSNANTGHFVTAWPTASVLGNTLLMYDRLFSVAKTMNTNVTEAVTGTFTRYQNQTAGTDDYIGGNFCFPSVPTTVLPATAHNWTVCQYTDDGGNTGQSFPSIAGVSACVKNGVDLAVGNWFMPLAAGDVGVKALTQMQCSANVATGTVDFVVGHPIAFMPCPIANLMCVVDGVNTAFNLTKIYDNAALAFMEMPKPATTATTYSGQVLAVSE